jgi:LL-diaminopimelate aminotransferase
MAGGEICPLPLLEENGWLPDLESIDGALALKANVVWLNYPNNPTGAVADLEFFDRVVRWAKQHDVIVAHDNPYSDVTYDGYRPPSILEVPGAKDICVEFNSLSKTYSMAGWRIGMAVGNREIIDALARIKTNIDSGIYGAVQDAAIAALTGDQSWIPARNEIYQRRRDKLCATLSEIGIHAPRPGASLYIWGRVPGGYTSKQFTEFVLASTGIVITPGNSYGAQGEGYFRMSLTVPDAEVDEACKRLSGLQFVPPADEPDKDLVMRNA